MVVTGKCTRALAARIAGLEPACRYHGLMSDAPRKHKTLSARDFDLTAGIWVLASQDENPTMTYVGIATRLAVEQKRVRQLVKCRPDLFRPGVPPKKGWRDSKPTSDLSSRALVGMTLRPPSPPGSISWRSPNEVQRSKPSR